MRATAMRAGGTVRSRCCLRSRRGGVAVAGFALREDVPAGQFLFGVVAGLLGVAIPLVAFYTLGFFVRRPWLAGLLWFGGTFLLGPYAFVAWFVFALGVACEPGCLS
jgi:hypothetical protein